MKNEDSIIEIIESIVVEGKKTGILGLTPADEILNGRIITLDNKQLINFGSCSYLGLEMDPRLRRGVIDAVKRYGTQFSASRSYLSAPPYKTLEVLFKEIFHAYPVITATTTLGHLSALPVLIGPKDAIILDRQVHNSVQLAASLCQFRGTPSHIIHHSRMDLLEEAIKDFHSKNVEKIWYLADGVYSMYGDIAPVDEIIKLLNKYHNFYLYIDDAHGMSWFGRNGRGTVLGYRDIHPKMIVAVSLNKAFAAAGGLLVFPNQEWAQKVLNCGGTLIFSGPIQPPMLGAAIESAKIHLSGEIHEMQKELHEKIAYSNQVMRENNLPLLSDELSTIQFIGIGSKHVTSALIKQLMAEGFYTCLATFPAVAMKRSGVRITINRHLTKGDIKGLAQAIRHYLPILLEQEHCELDFLNTFGNAIPKKAVAEKELKIQQLSKTDTSEFNLIYENSIKNISKEKWNHFLGDKGAFDWDNLIFLENLFSNQNKPENNWQFHYFIVEDKQKEISLITFFTTALCKDDMFSPTSVSEKIEAERERRKDPYYFTSKVLMMGSLLTEGNHLYVNRKKDWQKALKFLMAKLNVLQQKNNIEMILFRDLPANDEYMHQFMLDQGFVKLTLPDVHVYNNTDHSYQKTLENLPSRYRSFVKKNILKYSNYFDIEILDNTTRKPTRAELDQFYHLYQNVKTRGLELNVFDLPTNIFEEMLKTDSWELLLMHFKNADGSKKLVSICACEKNPSIYSPMIIGLDYDYVKSYGVYRQALYQCLLRGIALNAKNIHMGLTSSMQKKRIGIPSREIVVYVQATDNYKLEVLSQMTGESKIMAD